MSLPTLIQCGLLTPLDLAKLLLIGYQFVVLTDSSKSKGKVVATPCRQAAVVLQELEQKIQAGETVIQMGVVDALERGNSQLKYRAVVKPHSGGTAEEEKKDTSGEAHASIELPGAADGSNAREVICAVQKNNLLCTAFHPELTSDYRWHEYFAGMVKDAKA